MAYGVLVGPFRGLTVLVTLSFRLNLSFSSKSSGTLVVDEQRCFYLLSDSVYIIQIVVNIIKKIAFIPRGIEVIKQNCIQTFMHFWLQNMHSDPNIDNGFKRIKHTVSLGICRYLIFPAYGHDTPRVLRLKLEYGPIVQKCCLFVGLTFFLLFWGIFGWLP